MKFTTNPSHQYTLWRIRKVWRLLTVLIRKVVEVDRCSGSACCAECNVNDAASSHQSLELPTEDTNIRF